jgi:hypothetical protein
MTRTVQELLTTFERLSPQDQHAAAVEILRRVESTESALSDETLDRLADELFESLDSDEEGKTDGNASTR